MKIPQSQLPWMLSLVVAALFIWRWTLSQQKESNRRSETGSPPPARASGQPSDSDSRAANPASPPSQKMLGLQQKPAVVDITSPVLTKLASGMSRETQGLQIVTHPDGRQSVNMQGRFSTVIATVTGADGQAKTQCFTDHQELVNALSQTSPAAPTHHEK